MNADSVLLRTTPGPASTARDAAALPQRLKVLQWGVNESIHGPVVLDDAAAALFSAAQRAIGRERVALDFEHNTVEGTPEWKNSAEPRSIAAQGRPVAVPGDGLYLEDLTWTGTGASHAPDFEDLSPALYLDGTGRVLGMHSVALTRAGAVHGLTVRGFSADVAREITILSAGIPASTQTKKMSETTNAATAAPDTAQALAALAARLDEIVALLKTLKEPESGVETFSAKLQPLCARLDAIEAGREAAEREALLAQASREGKLVPLSADAAKKAPLDVLREIVANMPKGVVPLSASAAPGAAGGSGAFASLVASKAKEAGSKVGGLKLAIAADPEGHRAWLKEGAGKL